MVEKRQKVLICSCEDTMQLDAGAVARGCGAEVTQARHLCRSEIDQFRAAVESETSLTVCCTQEAPVFSELAQAVSPAMDMRFVNVRETAGWSDQSAASGPKMAALVAAASEALPAYPMVGLESQGVTLVYGRDDRAIEAANLLKEHLDVTVLINDGGHIAPPRTADLLVCKGRIRSAKGYLGAFELVVDDYAVPRPSSRAMLAFEGGQDGVLSRCDIVLDLSGNAPLFPAPDLRDGYLRADPGDPAAMLRCVLKARDLVGSFEKPRYIAFDAGLCAHARSRIVGCRRCLDLCPTGAIEPAGNHVAIDPNICAGCGQCAAACPTGAAAYAAPPSDALIGRLRTLLSAYRKAGGGTPVVLLHDAAHGDEMIEALARHGSGLPANVLPLPLNEVTQIGLEGIVAAFAYGADAVRILLHAKPRHDVTGLTQTIERADRILAGLGFGEGRVATIETDDPDALGTTLRALESGDPIRSPATFAPVGAKREMLRLSLRELHRVAPAPVDVISLPEGAPVGAISIDVEGCTLCLACVSACPTGALIDNPERPMLRFIEDACVQCGLCKATCPEKVISLVPRIDFRAAGAAPHVLKEEEPFECISCGKPFGTKSTIERIVGQLADRHWMFRGSSSRADVLKMCENCRVAAIAEDNLDPHGAPPPPRVRTTDDYRP